MNLSSSFKNIPALIGLEPLHVLDQLRWIVGLAIFRNLSKRPARSIELATNFQDSSKSAAVLPRATDAPHAKWLNPNRVESNLASEIEFGAARLVEGFNLEGPSNCAGERPFARARHARDRVRHANDAHPVSNLNVTANDVS